MKAPPARRKPPSIALDGPARRFEMGAVGFLAADRYLIDRGYTVQAGPNQKYYNVIGPKGGVAVKLTKTELMDLMDYVRVKAGLQPVKVGGGTNAAVFEKLLRANKRGPKGAQKESR